MQVKIKENNKEKKIEINKTKQAKLPSQSYVIMYQ